MVGTNFLMIFDPRSKGVKKGPFWDVIWFIQFILCQCLQIFKFFFTSSTTKTKSANQSKSKAKKNWSNGNWKNWKSNRKEKGAVTNVYFLQIKIQNLIVKYMLHGTRSIRVDSDSSVGDFDCDQFKMLVVDSWSWRFFVILMIFQIEWT